MKQIPGYEDYLISEYGVVNSKKMYRGNNIHKPHLSKDGYLKCSLRGNNKRIHASIHRLVAITYIPNKDKTLEVNHIDGNKLNNHFSNLEWVTHLGNMQHARKTGLLKPRYKGESGRAVLVLNTETGIFYDTAMEAAESTGRFKRSFFCMMLKGQRRNQTAFIYA